MTPLGPVLARLGLEQYLNAFVGEGFDSWETVLDITESDLDALNVKLGHRRKLQREIANSLGVEYERPFGPPQDTASDGNGQLTESQSTATQAERRSGSGSDGKRKYRRHPKPDENAPERPPSAYVIFSNKIREDVKGQNLSFTEIAKLVGENWQHLEPSEREPYENQATAAKDRYNAELAKYKKTPEYAAYMEYLADFKAKHGQGSLEGKRPKLDKEASTASSGSVASARLSTLDSVGSASTHSRAQSFGSSAPSGPLPSPGNMVSGMGIPPRLAPSTSSSPGVESSAFPRPGSTVGSTASTPLPFKVSSSPDEMPTAVPSYVDVRSHQVYPHPEDERRTRLVRPPPSLSHQDTSLSSVSSGSYSSGGDSSAAFKHQVKQEDTQVSRTLGTSPPLPSMEVPPSHGIPSLPPTFSRLSTTHNSGPYREHDNATPTGPVPGDPRWNDPSRILPPPRIPPTMRDSRALPAPVSERPVPFQRPPSEQEKVMPITTISESTDPLAVLAYAGDIVNRERSNPN